MPRLLDYESPETGTAAPTTIGYSVLFWVNAINALVSGVLILAMLGDPQSDARVGALLWMLPAIITQGAVIVCVGDYHQRRSFRSMSIILLVCWTWMANTIAAIFVLVLVYRLAQRY